MQAGPGKVLVDGTLGGGGHTGLMLERGADVYSIDRDPEAHAYAGQRLKQYDDRFHPLVGNFADALSLLEAEGVEKVDGILVDLGVSSRQFDCDERGFSFQKEGPLDMRMGPSSPMTAAEIVNQWPEQELARIFWEYGEERASRKIAKHLCQQREIEPYRTTTQLAASIEKLIPRHGKKIHPATKVFQALRIEVNDELGALKKLLASAAELLAPGGRLCVISFHSLEDRMVKRFLKHASQEEIDRPEWPEPRPNPDHTFKTISRKPIKATAEEVQRNPRSRSAILRVGERLQKTL
ncbi:16S rRNA (cytosine(1402)-N(4))-methyltransferase RsmH [Rubritalea tangerina]